MPYKSMLYDIENVGMYELGVATLYHINSIHLLYLLFLQVIFAITPENQLDYDLALLHASTLIKLGQIHFWTEIGHKIVTC